MKRKKKFKKRMEQMWEEKRNRDDMNWEELKEEVQKLLRKGQEDKKDGRRRWWNLRCRETKRKVRKGKERRGYREIKRENKKLCQWK